MPSYLLLVATALAVVISAEPFQSAPVTPTDASDSIYTTLSNNGPMAGTGPRRLEPLPTASAKERSDSIYTTLTHDSPMASFGQRRLEPLPTSNPEERSDDIYTPLSGDGPMGGKGQRTLRQ